MSTDKKNVRYSRFIPFSSSDMSVEKKGDDIHILRGYAAKFDSVSGDLFERSSGMREIIRAGFFRDALKQKETIHALFNHDENFVLGERSAGTMRIDEDSVGLPFEIELSDSQIVRDLVVIPISRKEISGCSWRGYADLDFVEYDRKADIFELLPGGCSMLADVGPVTKPAYTDTEISARSAFYENLKKPAMPPGKKYQSRSLQLLRLKIETGV